MLSFVLGTMARNDRLKRHLKWRGYLNGPSAQWNYVSANRTSSLKRIFRDMFVVAGILLMTACSPLPLRKSGLDPMLTATVTDTSMPNPSPALISTFASTLVPTWTSSATCTSTIRPTVTHTLTPSATPSASATPSPSTTSLPSITPSPTVPMNSLEKVIQVRADLGWQNTNVYITNNDDVLIQYVSGQWTHWKGTVPMSDASGKYGYVCADAMAASSCVEPVPDFRTGALIGQVHRRLLRIGNRLQFTSTDTGYLFLRINDADIGLSDNAGSITVKIIVRRPASKLVVAPTLTPRPTSVPTRTPKPAQFALPDLDVEYIARTPSYRYDEPKKWPSPGEIVTFQGHIANRGGPSTGSFVYAWFVDGVEQTQGTHPGLASNHVDTLVFSWRWQSGIHTIRLTLDPSNALEEVSENNNTVEDRINALSLGIWVEQSFYDFYNEHVFLAGWGGNSFADWLQRHVAIWNDMLASAVHSLTPQGIFDRFRLDKIVVVSDDSPCWGNIPANDRTVDLIWGFRSEGVGVRANNDCPGITPAYRDDSSLWDRDMGFLHELSHARYLVDLYGMNVESHEQKLVYGVGPEDRTLVLAEVPDIPEFRPPMNLIVNGELIVCHNRVGNRLMNCDRGQESTYRRAHPTGSIVFADQIHVQDGQGNALAGGAGLPAIHGAFFRNRYFGQDLMNAGTGYGEHSAVAWNRIAGQRPVCGNYNAPCNVGEYLNDIPADNVVELRWPDGTAIPGAYIEVFQARPYPIMYGKTYRSTPDFVVTTDESGRASLGAFPFGKKPPIVHGYGHSNAVLLLKIIAGDKVGAVFLDVTDFNIEYWRGNTQRAVYPITFEHYVTVQSRP